MITAEIAPDTAKMKSSVIVLNFVGAKANTKYMPFLGGIDCSMAVKPYGGRVGNAVMSDASGRMSMELYLELPYHETYSFDQKLDKKDFSHNVHSTNRLFELKSEKHTIRRQIPVKILTLPTVATRKDF